MRLHFEIIGHSNHSGASEKPFKIKRVCRTKPTNYRHFELNG